MHRLQQPALALMPCNHCCARSARRARPHHRTWLPYPARVAQCQRECCHQVHLRRDLPLVRRLRLRESLRPLVQRRRPDLGRLIQLLAEMKPHRRNSGVRHTRTRHSLHTDTEVQLSQQATVTAEDGATKPTCIRRTTRPRRSPRRCPRKSTRVSTIRSFWLKLAPERREVEQASAAGVADRGMATTMDTAEGEEEEDGTEAEAGRRVVPEHNNFLTFCMIFRILLDKVFQLRACVA